MKSSFKILSLVLLMYGLICPVITGRNFISIRQGEDTLNLNRFIRIDSFLLPIIPPASGVRFYKDKIVFLSLSKNERKMPPDQISFGAVEAYHASVEDSITGRHQIFLPGFSYQSEAMTFNPDYSTLYFSRSDRKSGKEKIYRAGFGMNEKNQPAMVTEPIVLDFCTDNSNYSHPALSGDGKFLVFASDRGGTLGGMDLFISRDISGKWSAPESLGKMINTAGNEYFPYLDQENNLYFSSDKLPGHGGYDLFSCKFNGENWDKPVNMSEYINSSDDDVAIVINKLDGKTGFFTRKSVNNMQLFRISLKPEISDRNLLAIFNGYPAVRPDLSEHLKPDTLTGKTEPLVTEPKPEEKKTPAKPAAATPGSKPPVAKSVIIKPTLPIPSDQKDVVIYRVQILSSNNPKREKAIMLNGKSYSLYEYFYLGSYRYSVGEFRTAQEALDLQRICRQSEYPQAFVAAFKNNTRSTDLKTFK